MLYHLSYVGVVGHKVYLLPLVLLDNGAKPLHTRRQAHAAYHRRHPRAGPWPAPPG